MIRNAEKAGGWATIPTPCAGRACFKLFGGCFGAVGTVASWPRMKVILLTRIHVAEMRTGTAIKRSLREPLLTRQRKIPFAAWMSIQIPPGIGPSSRARHTISAPPVAAAGKKVPAQQEFVDRQAWLRCRALAGDWLAPLFPWPPRPSIRVHELSAELRLKFLGVGLKHRN